MDQASEAKAKLKEASN